MTTEFKVDMNDGEHIYRHENNQIWQKYEIVNGKPHGKWLHFHLDGKPSIEEVYENGKKQGTWKSWHGSGEQWTEENYKDGKKNGVSRDGDGMELKNILADLKMINDTESGLIILIMVLR